MYSDNTTAIILAGGLGTRIKHLLKNSVPKPMVEVCGKPFIYWIIKWLLKNKITKIIISTGYGHHHIEDYVNSNDLKKYDITCIKEDKQLGTGGAIKFVRDETMIKPNNWLILNGDSLIFYDVNELYKDFNGYSGAIVSRYLNNASRYGTLITDKKNKLLCFSEKKQSKGFINAGSYLFKDSLIKNFSRVTPLSLENSEMPRLLRQHKIVVSKSDAKFIDIGTPESLKESKSFIEKNLFEF